MQAAHALSQDECTQLHAAIDLFEKSFERETRDLVVFAVTPKGSYDTNVLLERPENEFPAALRSLLPANFASDLKQAARCLIFDIPVGCAFHVCRATESLMLEYHLHLTKKPWPHSKRDWKIYIEQLTNQGAPVRITQRLDEIRALDRNAYIHPDKDVSLEEAQVVYKLCAGVNFYMLQEMAKPRQAI